MKKFIVKIGIYTVLLSLLAALFLLLIYLRPELVDNFYRRFTTPKGKSMILGTSRSAQGIKPSVLNSRITTGKNPMINHSFAIGPSSFGPNYLREIKHKIDPKTENGLFIISADPWSLTTEINNIEDDTANFFEVRQKLFVGNLKSSSLNPNFDYLKNYWSNRFSVFANLFKDWINYKNQIILHEDGWLEVNVVLNQEAINQRIKESTAEYAEKKVIISDTRMFYLEQIIQFLKNKGTVVVVRMPVSVPMYKLENIRFPEFSERIQTIASKNGVRYLDFLELSGQFQTVDTHHLYKKDAEVFTNIVCDSIVDLRLYNTN
ncbi:MAG: hypothetical protein KQI35_06795 [Bacteroidetes bacterium]|nr:hypothetical protein [Bacteroidota bacterium]